MPTMTGGRAVVEALIREGIDTVFGIPGVHTLEIYDELAGRSDEIRHVVTRHECGAGFMADGFARARGDIGVALVITGPGVTNAATALGEAWADSSPLLLISSQNRTEYMDRDIGALHQLKDQLSVTDGCTAYNHRVKDPSEIPQALADAVGYLRTHRPRPVHIDIPIDILDSKADMEFAASNRSAFVADDREVAKVARLLRRSKRPLLWLGGGAADATEELTKLVRLLDAAVINTCAGKGVVPEDMPNCLGNNLRSDEVREFAHSCDLLLVVGSELSVRETFRGELPEPETMIRVDVDAPGRHGLYAPDLEIQSDAAEFATSLLEHLRQQEDGADRSGFAREVASLRSQLMEETSSRGNGEIRAIVDILRQTLQDEDIVVCDMTMLCYRASSLYLSRRPRTFLFPRGFGTLGWSMPAAIGAKISQPQRNVVSLSGDGGFMFTAQELATAVKYELGLPMVVVNNEKYGVVASNQQRNYGRTIGVDISNPDFVQFAESFGARARRLTDPAQLPSALNEAFVAGGPTLIEIPADF